MLNVFNVEFKSLRELRLALGYTASMSERAIIESYGSLEKMIEQKTGLTDPDQISAKIQAMRESYRKTGTATPAQAAVDQNVITVLKAVYMQAPENARANVIAGVAAATSENVEDLTKRVNAFIS